MPDPDEPGKTIDNENLESSPFVVEQLEKEGFRTVSVAAGDSVSVAVSDQGDVRAWGSFRVCSMAFGRSQELTLLRPTMVSWDSTEYQDTTASSLHPSPYPPFSATRSKSFKLRAERTTYWP